MNQAQPLARDPACPNEAVVLLQTLDTHTFTFGADLENFFVLQGEPTSSDELCYINYSHCHLYADPETSAVQLKNSSTWIHTFKRRCPDSRNHGRFDLTKVRYYCTARGMGFVYGDRTAIHFRGDLSWSKQFDDNNKHCLGAELSGGSSEGETCTSTKQT